jgi:hypothetical protein
VSLSLPASFPARPCSSHQLSFRLLDKQRVSTDTSTHRAVRQLAGDCWKVLTITDAADGAIVFTGSVSSGDGTEVSKTREETVCVTEARHQDHSSGYIYTYISPPV